MKNKFITFAAFLIAKEISTEAFEEKSAEDKLVLFKEHGSEQEAYIESLKNDVDSKVSKEEIEAMKSEMNEVNARENKAFKEILSKQGVAITKMLENMKGGGVSHTAKSQIDKFISDNAEEIVKMKNQGHGMIELKVAGPITTASATNPNGIPELVGVQVAPPTNVNLRMSIVDSLVSMFDTNQAAYPYTDTIPKDGDFEWVGESGIKPEMDFTIETRYAEPKKIAAHMVLTSESIQDIPGLQSIANNYLRAKHDLKRQNGILFGTGVGDEPEGATVYGRLFVAGAMANLVADPNFMDVVNAACTDIYTTHNYVDEMNYMANIVMVNPIDFYINLVAAKDLNGLPLYPMASLFNRVMIGGATIVPEETIPAGKILVADMSKYNVTNYVGYTVRVGWINDQFITNQFCIVGESRLHAFVKFLDEQAFIYDDIATIKAAILLP